MPKQPINWGPLVFVVVLSGGILGVAYLIAAVIESIFKGVVSL